MTPLVDAHCHLDLYADPIEAIRHTDSGGVWTIAVTNTPSVFRTLVELVARAKRVHAALGLHPQLASRRASELPLFRELLPETRYVGEVGLDHTTSREDDRRVQRRVFDAVLGWCDEAGDKILTVHSRRAAEDVVDAVGSRFRGVWILHWYSGSRRTLERALANGAYVSVNPAMVRSVRGRALLAAVPSERTLTETDGPFASVEGAPARPVDAVLAVRGLAALWRVTPEAAQHTIYETFSTLGRLGEL
jgi:TatD DNase family protein